MIKKFRVISSVLWTSSFLKNLRLIDNPSVIYGSKKNYCVIYAYDKIIGSHKIFQTIICIDCLSELDSSK